MHHVHQPCLLQFHLDYKTIDYQARTPASYRATDGRVQGDR